MDPLLSLGGEAWGRPAPFFPRKAIAQSVCTQWLESIVTHRGSLASISALCHMPLSPAAKQPLSGSLGGPFVLGKTKYPLPDVLQEGEWFLPVRLRGSPHPSILWEPYALFFLLLSPSHPGFTLQKWLLSQHLTFSLPKFTAPNLTSAMFCLFSCADYFLNPQMIF